MRTAKAAARDRVLSEPRPFRATVRTGELLAIEPQAFGGFFFFGGAPPNDRTEDGIAIITIQGPLEFHSTWCWENYEDILCRVEDAMTGEDLVKMHERRNGWRDDYQPAAACPARAVVLCIDSPGGEAAGSMYCARKLRSLRKKYDVPLYAYANEMACSAAYAIASACDEIWTSDTGTVGSIGVIATMYDRTGLNEKNGLLVKLITSGAYKADNHADRTLTGDIEKRMQARVDSLADVFFKVVARSRGTSPKAIASLEAGVFIGPDAVRVGLADGVARYDKFLALVARSLDSEPAAPAA